MQGATRVAPGEILRRAWTGELSAGELHESFGDVTFGAISQTRSLHDLPRLAEAQDRSA